MEKEKEKEQIRLIRQKALNLLKEKKKHSQVNGYSDDHIDGEQPDKNGFKNGLASRIPVYANGKMTKGKRPLLRRETQTIRYAAPEYNDTDEEVADIESIEDSDDTWSRDSTPFDESHLAALRKVAENKLPVVNHVNGHAPVLSSDVEESTDQQALLALPPVDKMPGERRGRSTSPVPRAWHTPKHKPGDIQAASRAHNGRLVTFYRNGDPNYKGLVTSVTQRAFATFETLLTWLNDKIPTRDGVRYIFNLADGFEVLTVEGLKGGQSYVVSSTRKLRRINYGNSREHFWINRKPSGGRNRRGDHQLVSKSEPSSVAGSNSPSRSSVRSMPAVLSPPVSRARIFTIVSNTNRDSTQKVILNPKTTQSFEDMLQDVTQMIQLQNPPAKCLYTARKPFKEVMTYTQLLRDFATHEVFLACGTEGKPLEVIQKKQLAPEQQPTRSPKIHRRFKNRQQSKAVVEPKSQRRESYRKDAPIDPLSDEDERVSEDDLQYIPQTSRVPEHKTVYRDLVQVNVHGERREFYAPRNADLKFDGSKPEKRLQLEWVYGYRGRDGKNNLHVLPTGELLYNVGAVAVIYDRKRELQKHYQGHSEDITCLAVHPNRKQPYVASGQLAGKEPDNLAHIRVWDSRTLTTHAIIGEGAFQQGVSSVSFSVATGDAGEPGDLLVAVDEGEKHILSVWNWPTSKMVAKTTASSETVVWASFHPQDHQTIVTYGRTHIYFWQLQWQPDQDTAGKLVRDKDSGDFENEGMPKFVTALAFSAHGDVISGDSSGRILVWRKDTNGAYVIDRRCSEHLRTAHTRSIFALYMLGEGTLLSGGGNTIKCWDTMNYYQPLKEHQIPEHTGMVRCLAPLHPERLDGPLYIGTTRNMILEGTLDDKSSYLVQGHSEELWALAVHPEEHSFVTAGYDQQVCRWSAVKHKLIWRVHIEQPCLSAAFDPKGQVVVLGTTGGRFIVLNAYNGMHVTSVQVGMEQLDALAFSPDGELLAMGSHDCNIYIYSVVDEGQVYRKFKSGLLKGHKNFITHLDWSPDSNCLRSVSGNYDLLFWNVSQMVQEDAEIMRDKDWATHTCILGYDVHGAWTQLRADDDLNTVDRSNDHSLLATGDNYGHIRLYKHPCITSKPKYQETKKCSSHVTKARFTFDDKCLITTGGSDAALMQWNVVDSNLH